MKIRIPDDVNYIIKKLNDAGYEAYAVGGCIRDSILGRIPDDWDITTSAKPQQVKELFTKTIDTGIAHGTVTIMRNHVGYEVTTYRIDGEYEDSRHPKEVMFTSDLLEDLKRRDFTINAMAYNEQTGLVDAFGGIQDIENKIIRCVGSPVFRFQEDALRMMRAVRFSAQLGYEIEEETQKAIRQLAGNLKNISVERIQVELVKLLVSDHPDYLRKAYELGMTKVFFKEFDKAMETKQNNPHHMYTVGEHMLQSLNYIENKKVLRLTMLLHDIAKPETISQDQYGIHHFYGHCEKGEEMAYDILRRLRFDNDTINKVCVLIKHHDQKLSDRIGKLRKTIGTIGLELFPMLLEVKQADLLAQSNYQRYEKQEELDRIRVLYERILEEKDCLTLKDLAITGKDLIANGEKPGKELGIMLQYLLDHVLENPKENQKDILLELWRRKKQGE